MKKIKNQLFMGSRKRASLWDCFYIENGMKKPVLVFCHGFKGFKDWGCFNLMAETFAQAGLVCIKFNFSYNGGTTEDPIDFPDLEAFSENNFSTELNDLGVILDLLEKGKILPNSEFDSHKINLIGHSRGGGIVLLKTAEDPRIHKTVTLASVSDFEYFFKADEKALAQFKKAGVVYVENQRTHQSMPIKYQIYEDYKQHKSRLNILANCKKITQEVAIFHGTEDVTVPLINAKKLEENITQSRLFVVNGADHTMGAYHPYSGSKLPENFSYFINQTIQFLQ